VYSALTGLPMMQTGAHLSLQLKHFAVMMRRRGETRAFAGLGGR
jgi:hypothetical protein